MSHEKFELGEIAVIVNAHPMFQQYVNTECEIIGVDCYISDDRPSEYFIQCADGFRCYASSRNLRKRRPPAPREQTTTWDDVIVWRPKSKEKANV